MKRPFEFEFVKRCIIFLKSVIRWWLFCDCKGMDNNNTQVGSGILEVRGPNMYKDPTTTTLTCWPVDTGQNAFINTKFWPIKLLQQFIVYLWWAYVDCYLSNCCLLISLKQAPPLNNKTFLQRTAAQLTFSLFLTILPNRRDSWVEKLQ